MKPFEIEIIDDGKSVKITVAPHEDSDKFDVYGPNFTTTIWAEQTKDGVNWIAENILSRSLLKKIADKIEKLEL